MEPPGLFVPGRNCHAVAHADRVAFLVDGEAYFRAFAQAAERATRSIMVVAWDFNSGARLRFDGNEKRGAPPAELGDFLNWLARRRRELQIYVLDWDYPMVFGTDREFPPLYGFGWTPHRRVHVHFDDTHPVGGSHHQKIVVIDGVLAFVGGFDLAARRWDTRDHRAEEARRAHGQEFYPPFHDLMAVMDGEAARVLAGIARERWRGATGQTLKAAAAEVAPWPAELTADLSDVNVAMARTFPPGPEPLVREVEQLYLDMIAAARRCIYIENQYFTAQTIGDALVARLAEPDGPEIVLVTRLLSHGWLEEHTMHVLRTRLLLELGAADRGGRFHAYYPHIDGLREGTCIDVHSKLMIVDDEILRIGSANLCNRSMGLDSECDVAIEARADARVARAIGDFRHRLLGEHLGVSPAEVGREFARRGSLHRTIEALRGSGRSLRPLDHMPEWPEAVVQLARVADPGHPVIPEAVAAEFRAAESGSPRRGVNWVRLAAVILAVAALAAVWRYTPLAEAVSPARVVHWAHDFAERPWAPLAILVAYTPASLLMFPRALITLAAVVGFGPYPGIAFAVAGGLLAAYFSYLAGRRLPRGTVRSLVGDKFNGFTDLLRQRGLMAMTAVRLVPVMPFIAVGLVAGAIHIRLQHFMLGTLFGMAPGTVTAVIFGNQIEVAVRDPSQVDYGMIAVAVAGIVLIAIGMGRWLNRQRRRLASGGEPAESGPRSR